MCSGCLGPGRSGFSHSSATGDVGMRLGDAGRLPRRNQLSTGPVRSVARLLQHRRPTGLADQRERHLLQGQRHHLRHLKPRWHRSGWFRLARRPRRLVHGRHHRLRVDPRRHRCRRLRRIRVQPTAGHRHLRPGLRLHGGARNLGREPISTDNCSAGSGNNTYYHISGFAAFYLSGWRLTKGNQVSVRPPNVLCGSSNSQRCLSGWFLRDLIPSGDFVPSTPTNPNYGITIVKPAG